MILYSKRTDANAPTNPIHPRIAYIYWDFDKRTGGHLDKDKRAFSRPSAIRFDTMKSFYEWRNTYKKYWQEPTSSLIEDYLQVDEGL